jgi:DNA-binding response OmpR family regulator
LIVEDNTALARLIKSYLAHEGYRVAAVRTAAGMRAAIEAGKVDLVILDVMLPDEDGWSALGWIRARGGLPVLMLGDKSDPLGRLVGADGAADDYLATPFELHELLARLRGMHRHRERVPSTVSQAGATTKVLGWVLDPSSHRLTTKSGRVVVLTALEYRILLVLVAHPHRPVSREQLLAAVGRNWRRFDRKIDVHISNLRRKLDLDPRMPSVIRTVRGIGYMFMPNDGS